jgi:hypothetical protein
MTHHDAVAPRQMLLATFGTVGDLLPVIGPGQAQQRRGHAVPLLAAQLAADPPLEALCAVIEAAQAAAPAAESA